MVRKAPKKAAPVVKKKAADPLFPARPRNFRIGGDIRPTGRDLGRFVKWPRYVRLQRQKQILMDRLSVPPAVNQFSHSMTKDKATALFKLLAKYRPEAPADKKARLLAAAEATAAGKDVESKGPACAIKFGLKHVTALVEEKKAKLVIIASDVDPIELVVWLPALCRKMNVPYCIVKNKSRLGALVYQKNATALCLTSVNKADESELRNLEENCMDNFNGAKMTWLKSGAPVMGLKTQMRLHKRQVQLEKELEKRNQS